MKINGSLRKKSAQFKTWYSNKITQETHRCIHPGLSQSLYAAITDNDLDKARIIFDRQSELLNFITANGLPRTIAAGLTIVGVERASYDCFWARFPKPITVFYSDY